MKKRQILRQMHIFGGAVSHQQSGQTLALEEKPWQYKISLQDVLCSIVGIGKLQDRIRNKWEEAEQVIPSSDKN